MKRQAKTVAARGDTIINLVGLIACLLSLLILLVAGSAVAEDQSAARSVAMGGAYIGLAKGPDAAKFNPANLGLTDFRRNGMEIVGVGLNVSNNAFTLSDYNKYTGAFLTDQDKQDILDKIPSDGLRLNVDARATAMSVARGNYAFTLSGVGVADVNMSKDLMDLVLNGNTFADTIDVTGSYSDAYSYAAAGVSYGMPIYSVGSRQLAVGATFKYITGFAVEEVVELEGMAATFATGFQGEGHLIARTATGGKGYAMDIGASLQIDPSLTVGARVENLLGSITWSNETEEHGYVFSFDTMTVDNMDEDYVTSDDYTRSIGSFSTRLPAVLTVGGAKSFGKLIVAVDWQQGLSHKPGISTEPLIHAGLEWSPLRFLPLRAGFKAGGDRNTGFSAGSGLDLKLFYLDFAVVTGTSISGYSTKGLNVALATGLRF